MTHPVCQILPQLKPEPSTQLDAGNGWTYRVPTDPGWYLKCGNKPWHYEGDNVLRVKAVPTAERDFRDKKYPKELEVLKKYCLRPDGTEMRESIYESPELLWDPESQFDTLSLFKPCQSDTPIPTVCGDTGDWNTVLEKYPTRCKTCGGFTVYYQMGRSQACHSAECMKCGQYTLNCE